MSILTLDMQTQVTATNRLTAVQAWLLLLGAGFLAVYAAALVLGAGESYLRIQSNIVYNLPAMVALVLVLRRAHASRKAERWGWSFFAVMLATWLTGDWTYSYYDLGLNTEPPFPGVADIFYTAGYASMLVALPLLAYPRRLVGNLRWVLDVALIMTVVGCFQWVLTIEPLIAESGTDTWASALALSYPLWDIGLIAVIIGGMLAWHGNLSTRSKVLLVAMGTLAVTDTLYSYGLALTSYENVGNPLELGWMTAYLLIGLAATMTPDAQPVRFERRLPLFWLVFPYVLALPLPIVQAVRASSNGNVDVLSLGAAAVLMMAFLSHVHASYMTTRALDDERRKARLDSLTGTLNHGGVIEEAEALIAANPVEQLTVAMVDLDGLKAINDILGHQVGDLALKVMASRLRRSGGIVGRYGGDEFLVLFEPHNSIAGFTPEDLLRQAVNGAFIGAGNGLGNELTIGASFGLALYPDEAPDLATAIELADASMYEQKRQRRKARDARPIAGSTSLTTQVA